MFAGLVQYSFVFTLVVCILCTVAEKESPPPCNSQIYCHGPLLHVVQMAKPFADSKTFVDMKLKYSPNETLQKFDLFMQANSDRPTKKDVRKFLADNFDNKGQEFEEWIPNDWKENPTFLSNIRDPLLRQWGSSLNDIWKELGRKFKADIKANQQYYSIIWVPNPVIVPGGRFREFYYWDSYWIVQGLLLSEMYDTVQGMLDNFLYMVDTYGHVPNGGRIYYLQRSQPPFLVPMVKLYVDVVKDMRYVADNIETLENEFLYWITNHSKTVIYNGKNYTLAMYGDKSWGPRPESYFEDVSIASFFSEEQKKEKFYSELKAAAESGWDFSSRWFITNATNRGNLTDIHTKSIIPVDLNALIYWNAIILAEFNQHLNNLIQADRYRAIAEQWLDAVTAVLWHEDLGIWLDYDILNSVRRDYFYPSNLVPLLTNCYPKENKEEMVKSVLKYLQRVDVIYPGGIPTTTERTGEQWDFPNAWPPLQHMVVVGLHNTGNQAAERVAYEISKTWILSTYKSYNATEAMYEKYDATISGGFGGGGEYEVQKGFGWTNGVVMDFLNRYGDILKVDHSLLQENEILAELHAQSNSTLIYGQMATVVLVLILSLTAGFIGLTLYRKYIARTQFNQSFMKAGIYPKTRYTELKDISQSYRNIR